MTIKIAPSILSADFSKLGDEVINLEQSGADWLHFDVMDNHFVPNLTFGAMVLEALKNKVSIPFDVHLMAMPVDDLITAFAKAGANSISFHPEASLHVHRSLMLLDSFGCKRGLVLNPASSLELVLPCLDMLDFVLFMSVNPGFGGQKFIPSTFAKIEQFATIRDSYFQKTKRYIEIEVDGGVNNQNCAALAQAGCDILVAGSAVFSHPDENGSYTSAISTLRKTH